MKTLLTFASKSFSKHIFIAISFALLQYSACAADMGPSYQPADCIEDNQCDIGMACSPWGECLPLRDPLELPLGLEIYDQRVGSPKLGQLIYDLGPSELVPDEDGIVRVTIPDAFSIEGTVRTNAIESTVQALLLSYRLSHIPGRGVTSASQTLGRVDSGGVPYEISLIQPDLYVLQVVPQPATTFSPLVIYDEFLRNTQVNFTLGVVNYEVIGRLVDSAGNPVLNATVWIFDFETGASSTVATTSAMPESEGEFRCRFTDVPRSLSIFTGAGNTGVVQPSVLFEVSISELDAWTLERGSDGYDGGDLVIPALAAPITFGTNIFGYSGAGSLQVVSGAQVTFRAVVGGGTRDNGVVVAEGTTNEEGNVTVSLVPGDFETGRLYEVTVTTPIDSPFASTKKELMVGPISGYGESIELERRVTAVGQVTSPDDGSPLALVTVKATPSTSSTGNPNEDMINTTYQPSTQTDSSGWFTLLLDPGYYDFSLIFPDRLKYPNTTFFDQIVAQLRASTAFAFSPARPALVKVLVQDARGAALSSMEVRAYQVAPECPLAGECTVPAQLLSSARSDAAGRASLIVP